MEPVIIASAHCFDTFTAARDEALKVDTAGGRRVRITADRPRICRGGRELIHFGSNDYLGLAADPRVLAAVTEAVDQYGWGNTASSAFGGRGRLHAKLEQRLADFFNAEAALLFSSGYMANLDMVRALVMDGDVVFCDEQNHQSILDAARLSGAAVRFYRHCDCDHLSSLLLMATHYRRRLIVSESLFGNDGSFAPLADLADLAERHDAKLLVDEAHTIGTHGDCGNGAADFLAERDRLVARVGTLGKALGGMGGFIAASRSLVESLSGSASGYQHSTCLPPAACAAALAAIEIVETEPTRRTVLRNRADGAREVLLRQGWNVRTSASHIIPIWIEDPGRAEAIAAALCEAGDYLPSVTPPRVRGEKSMLRLRISYGHEPWMIEGMLFSFEKLSKNVDCLVSMTDDQ